jgi:hypothetical protein
MVPGHAAARAPATWRSNRDRVRGADRRPGTENNGAQFPLAGLLIGERGNS